MKAQHTLHTGNYEHTDYNHVHDLYLMAYGDEDLAARAKSEAAAAYADKVMAESRANK